MSDQTNEPYQPLDAQQQVPNEARPNNAENNRQNQDYSPVDIVLKVGFILISIPWIILDIFFSIFDTKCIIFEQASAINCSQDFFISNPRHWISAWLFMSIISSFLLIFIIYINHEDLHYKWMKAKNIYKKGSFYSLIFLLVVSSVYYFIHIFTIRSEPMSLLINILNFLWPFVTVLLVCCLNYLPRVRWNNIRPPRCTSAWWKECLRENSNFIIYWLALVVYFVEVTCKLVAIMLDVAHDVAPLIQRTFPQESGTYWGGMVIIIGFVLAFHARLLTFFWQKLFHGEKDLFSEPSTRLDYEPPLDDDQMEAGENIELENLHEI